MPQATQELRDKMEEYFGDDDEMYAPLRFLLANGWTCTSGGILSEDKTYAEITQKEWDCCDFLAQEWDYGYTPGKRL